MLPVSVSLAHINIIPLKQPGILNVTSYSEFTPVSYGNGQGYEADLLKAIIQLWHVNIKFHPTNNYQGLWLIPSKPGSISDISIGGMTPTDYRIKEGAVFSVPTTWFAQSLLVRKKDYNSGRIRSYSSFKNSNMKIGVVPETTGEQYAHLQVKKNGLSDSVLIRYSSESELLPALNSGEIDAIARGEIGNEYQASMNKHLITIAKKNYKEGFAFAVDSSNAALVENINQGISVVTNKGRITYIKWLKNHNVFHEYVAKLIKNDNY